MSTCLKYQLRMCIGWPPYGDLSNWSTGFRQRRKKNKLPHISYMALMDFCKNFRWWVRSTRKHKQGILVLKRSPRQGDLLQSAELAEIKSKLFFFTSTRYPDGQI